MELLQVVYWLGGLRKLKDEGLGERDVRKVLLGTCLLANSAIEPVSTEAEDILLRYDGLGDLPTNDFPFSIGLVITCISFKGFVTNNRFPLRSAVGGLGGALSSKLMGNVLDFLTGNMLRPIGGFFGVVSIGGDMGPFDVGDSRPFVPFEFPLKRQVPFSGIWRLSAVPALEVLELTPLITFGMSIKLCT